MLKDRERRSRWSTLLIFLVLSVVSLLMLVFGDAEDRWQGMVGLVFFGLGGLVYWRLSSGPRRSAPPLARTAGIGGQEVVFPISRAAMGLFAVGAAVFVTTGAAFLRAPDAWTSSVTRSEGTVWIAGLLSVAFFGPLLAFAVVGLVRGGGLTLTPEHLTYRSSTARFSVRWDDIKEVSQANHGGQPTLDLRVTDAGLSELGAFQRMYSRLQRRFFHTDLSIPLRALRSEPAVIAAAVTHLKADPHDRSDPVGVVTQNEVPGDTFPE